MDLSLIHIFLNNGITPSSFEVLDKSCKVLEYEYPFTTDGVSEYRAVPENPAIVSCEIENGKYSVIQFNALSGGSTNIHLQKNVGGNWVTVDTMVANVNLPKIGTVRFIPSITTEQWSSGYNNSSAEMMTFFPGDYTTANRDSYYATTMLGKDFYWNASYILDAHPDAVYTVESNNPNVQFKVESIYGTNTDYKITYHAEVESSVEYIVYEEYNNVKREIGRSSMYVVAPKLAAENIIVSKNDPYFVNKIIKNYDMQNIYMRMSDGTKSSVCPTIGDVTAMDHYDSECIRNGIDPKSKCTLVSAENGPAGFTSTGVCELDVYVMRPDAVSRISSIYNTTPIVEGGTSYYTDYDNIPITEDNFIYLGRVNVTVTE